MRIASSVGIDATIVVKGHQLLQSERLVVGGAYPNYLMDVSDLDKDGLKTFLKDFLDRKKEEVAVESKMAVLSFQVTPTGMCSYLI